MLWRGGIIMNINQFQTYIEENSRIKDLFYEKVLAHENKLNEEKQRSKRKNEAVIHHITDRLYDKMMVSLFEQIKNKFKNDTYKKKEKWIAFFENSDALLDIEDSMADLEFEEEV